MNIDALRALCRTLPNTREDVKLESDLCFSVDGKIFCLAADDVEGGVSFKVKEEEFRDMTHNREGVIPAPYMARFKWVYVLDYPWLSDAEWVHYVTQSYELVKAEKPQNNLVEGG